MCISKDLQVQRSHSENIPRSTVIRSHAQISSTDITGHMFSLMLVGSWDEALEDGNVWVRLINKGGGGPVGPMQVCICGGWACNVVESAYEWWVSVYTQLRSNIIMWLVLEISVYSLGDLHEVLRKTSGTGTEYAAFLGGKMSVWSGHRSRVQGFHSVEWEQCGSCAFTPSAAGWEVPSIHIFMVGVPDLYPP